MLYNIEPMFAYEMDCKVLMFALFQRELEDLRELGQRTPRLAIGASLASAGLMFGAAATSNQDNHADIWTTANLPSKFCFPKKNKVQ